MIGETRGEHRGMESDRVAVLRIVPDEVAVWLAIRQVR